MIERMEGVEDLLQTEPFLLYFTNPPLLFYVQIFFFSPTVKITIGGSGLCAYVFSVWA